VGIRSERPVAARRASGRAVRALAEIDVHGHELVPPPDQDYQHNDVAGLAFQKLREAGADLAR
jgi:hypothetical protein